MELFIFTRLHARPTREKALEDALRYLLAISCEQSGCLDIRAFRSTHDARLFYVHSRWANEAAFEAHVSLPQTLRFNKHVKSLIDHPLEVTRAELIT